MRLMEKMQLPDIDFLKVGHHGSKNSSSGAFIGTLSPETGFISCSPGNLHGHPSPEALARLAAAGCDCYCTAWDGMLTFSVSPEQTPEIYGFLEEPRVPDS